MILASDEHGRRSRSRRHGDDLLDLNGLLDHLWRTLDEDGLTDDLGYLSLNDPLDLDDARTAATDQQAAGHSRGQMADHLQDIASTKASHGVLALQCAIRWFPTSSVAVRRRDGIIAWAPIPEQLTRGAPSIAIREFVNDRFDTARHRR